MSHRRDKINVILKWMNQLHLTIGDKHGWQRPDEVEVSNTHSVVKRLYTKPGSRYLTTKSRRRGGANVPGYFYQVIIVKNISGAYWSTPW